MNVNYLRRKVNNFLVSIRDFLQFILQIVVFFCILFTKGVFF
jgi:hypothetical protein